MTQSLQCPTCSQKFRVLPEQAGSKVKCPGCLKVVVVPGRKRDSNLDPPNKKTDAKKTDAKKTDAKKPVAKKPAAKKANAEKTGAEKTGAKQTDAKQTKQTKDTAPSRTTAASKSDPPNQPQTPSDKPTAPKSKTASKDDAPIETLMAANRPAQPEQSQQAESPRSFTCPHCSNKFGVNRAMAGSDVRCPTCTKPVSIPGWEPVRSESKSKVKNSKPAQSQPATGLPPTTEAKDPVPGASKQRWKGRHQDDSPDLYAPGHEKSPQSASVSDGETRNSDSIPASKRGLTSQLLEEPNKAVEQKPVDHLLPPKFEYLDPKQIVPRVSDPDQKIYLPDGEGGVQRLDNRVVSIRYAGEKVTLSASSDREKSTRRFWSNLLTLGLLGGFLLLVLYLVLEYF